MARNSGNLDHRPSSGLVVFALGLIGLFAGIYRANSWAIAFGMCLTLLSLALYFMLRYSMRHVHVVQLTPPEKCFEGDELNLRVRIENHSRLPVFFPRFEDEFAAEFGARKTLIFPQRIDPGEVVTGQYAGTCLLPRGVHQYGQARLILSDPLGWFERRILLTSTVSLRVSPRFDESGIRFDSIGNRSLWGPSRRNAIGQSQVFRSIRDYRIGDPMRRIHWRTTAKTQVLSVMECDAEGEGGLVVFVDLCFKVNPFPNRHSAFERSLKSALGIFAQALKNRSPIAMMARSDGQFDCAMTSNPRAIGTIVNQVIDMQSDDQLELHEVIKQRFQQIPRDGFVILFVHDYLVDKLAFLDSIQELRRIGNQVVCILTSSQIKSSYADALRKAGAQVKYMAPSPDIMPWTQVS